MIGENIKKIRLAKGLNQKELAKRVHVVPSMICQIERGSRTVSLVLAEEMAQVLGCDIKDFIGEGGRQDVRCDT